MVGRVIDGKYRVVAAIGEGGMSSIYEAEHLGLDRHVALKVLHPALADDPEAIARLQQEAKVVSTINHPNLCEVFDLGRTKEGSPFLVMELLVGETLAERLKSDGAMSFGELAPLVRQVLAALSAAHQKGILHRDLKPENVFIEERRKGGHGSAGLRAKLLDFGISKSMSYDFFDDQRLTHSGMVMGTPYYMAPEQARGDSSLDQRVDLWAVGVVMYEALAGRRPFVATNYNALLVKILTSRPRPLQKLVRGLPDDVAALVERALSKLREDRFQTAEEFISAVERIERKRPASEAHAPTMMYRRPEPPAVPTARRSVDWAQAIDDPSTFVDDELSDPAHLPRGSGESGRREGAAHEEDDADEHLRDTVQDRPARNDTEVMSREDLEQAALRSDTTRETAVIDRRPSVPRPPGADRAHHPPPRRGSYRPPPAPRPPRPHEDDEKTTLYDIEAAKARLRERQEAQRRAANARKGVEPDDGAAL
jgi:serine/threonine protein kinase